MANNNVSFGNKPSKEKTVEPGDIIRADNTAYLITEPMDDSPFYAATNMENGEHLTYVEPYYSRQKAMREVAKAVTEDIYDIEELSILNEAEISITI
jgi:regulator of RNase E activity RraA